MDRTETRREGGRWRANLLFGLLCVGALALACRLVLLVRDGTAKAAVRARRQQRMVVPLPGRPGSIFARTRGSYVPVAVSRRVPSCFIDPLLVEDKEMPGVCIAVGEALGVHPVRLQERLVRRRKKRFLWVKRWMTDVEADRVREIGHPGVAILHEWQREYPNGALAPTVVGFRRRDGLPGGGIELAMNRTLSADDGERVMLADARRRPIWPVPSETECPRDGSGVFLCLDAVIQDALQSAVAESVGQFDAKWGTGVVMDPLTGEVLAMASAPAYDPSEYHRASSAGRTNRAVCVPYEPGSALKPIYAAAAAEAGVASFQTQIYCENGVYHARRGGRISDHGHRYGHLTLEDVVVHSSNIGMAKVGEMLGNRALHEIAGRFGFGRRTGVEVPGESPGIVRDLRKWDGYSLRRVPFGQEISVTCLQLATAFSALANGGELVRPRLIDRICTADGRVLWQSHRRVVRRVLKPQVARQALAAMEQVVERGTGKRCKLEHWTSFGKTGTAQIPGRGGYVDGAYTGTFVGGAPAGQPRVLCVISIYWPDRSKGYYGSKVAAPFVRKVLRRTLTYLNVPPDRQADRLEPTLARSDAPRGRTNR